MLKTSIVATAVSIAVKIVVDDIARVLPNKSNSIGVSLIDSSQAMRFGEIYRECGFALRQRKVSRVFLETFNLT